MGLFYCAKVSTNVKVRACDHKCSEHWCVIDTTCVGCLPAVQLQQECATKVHQSVSNVSTKIEEDIGISWVD